MAALSQAFQEGLSQKALQDDAADLLRAASEGQTLTFLKLLGNLVEVNLADAEGRTPLMLAIRHCDRPLECATAAVAAGADLNAQDNEGNTPLHHAIDKEQYDLVKLLIQHGAKMTISNLNGENAVKYADLRSPQFGDCPAGQIYDYMMLINSGGYRNAYPAEDAREGMEKERMLLCSRRQARRGMMLAGENLATNRQVEPVKPVRFKRPS